MFEDKRPRHSPKRTARAAGFVGGLVVYLLPHHHSLAVAVLAGALSVWPGMLVERWYRQRHRREEERLFVLPD